MSEFTFQGEGTLLRIDTFVSKAGKSILTLIFEQQGQYPQFIPIKVFGRLADQAAAWTPGSVLSVRGRLGGRDWQGKVYGDMVATSVDVVSDAAGENLGSAAARPSEFHDRDRGAPPPGDDDVPF
jgi:single-stranded DNA-binding protein